MPGGGDDSAEKGPRARGSVLAAWLLVLIPAAMLAILLERPIWDVDIFWQLKLGEMILARGAPVPTEPFAATHLGEPLPAVAWLGQVVMAEVRLTAGWTGLRLFDALCWLAGFLVVAAACRRRGASVGGLALGLAVALYLALPTASIRPQTFAVLCFGLLLALIRLELRPWRTLAIAVPLFVLWQNLHPSVSVAAVTFGVRSAVGWGRWLARREGAPWEDSALAALAGLAILATPDGWSAIRTSGENAQASTAMGVSEWLPLWHPVNHSGIAAVALAAILAAGLVAYRWRRSDLREIAVALAFLALTVLVSRFVLFWAMTLIPVFARAIPPAANPRRVSPFAALLLLAIVAGTMPFLRPTRFSPAIPLATIQALKDRAPAGTIFLHIPWGGPAIDIGYPAWVVAYDGRFYRYTPEELSLYRDISHDRVPLVDIVRRYRPVGFVLERDWNKSLIAELRADPAWQQVAEQGAAVAFVRRPGAAR